MRDRVLAEPATLVVLPSCVLKVSLSSSTSTGYGARIRKLFFFFQFLQSIVWLLSCWRLNSTWPHHQLRQKGLNRRRVAEQELEEEK